jgi:hypothetical protein
MRAFDNINKYLVLMLLALVLNACNITKQLRDSQQLLYKGSTIKVTGETRNDVVNPIGDNLKQKPNKKFLGVTKLKMRMYYFGSKHGESKIGAYMRDKYGEPPVILDTAFIESSVKAMKGYFRSIGFYYPIINYEVKSRRQRATVHYFINTGLVYHIGSYQINCADKNLYDVLKRNEKEALVVIGNRLKQDVLLDEQKRIVSLLRNNGYYTFSPEFVGFDVDTANYNGNVNVSLNVLNKGIYEVHKVHINKNVYVNIEPNYDINAYKNLDTIKAPSFYYIPNRYKLNHKVLEQNMFLTPGNVFKQQALSGTYNRLGDLSVFRYINITPKPYIQNDTQYIDYYVKLSPNIKYDYIIEPQAIYSDQNNTFTNQSSNGNYGVATILQFNNRNTFKNAELLKLTYRSSFEAQGKVNGSRWFNATEQSLTASLTFPRLVLFPKLDKNYRFVNTRTILTTSGIYELNTNFERRVFTTGIIYQLNKKYISFYITPFEVSYTRNTVNSDTLQSLINKDIYLFSMFSNNLILGGRFGFTYSDKAKNKGNHHVFLRWDVLELSGNTATALNKIFDRPFNETNTYNIFGVNYSQFAKTALDFRYNTKHDENNATVFRLFAGVGIPYGNSPKFLPFERRFWVGGANSLRAWLPRSLGPGGYYEFGQIDYSGDVKLEFNAEFRFNMYNRWLEGAVFVDAGNVWMTKKDASRPLANFEFNRFANEFGIGTGFGTRLNFDVILIRLDFAIPLHDPSYNVGSRWVINNFNQDWLFHNINFNFGIGYPF